MIDPWRECYSWMIKNNENEQQQQKKTEISENVHENGIENENVIFFSQLHDLQVKVKVT